RLLLPILAVICLLTPLVGAILRMSVFDDDFIANNGLNAFQNQRRPGLSGMMMRNFPMLRRV
ncbi:hypothetical protein PMAYCL1PPCAC_15087, partial [Pristionchus mayeri]